MKPLCVELYCGTFGWGAGFIAEGFDVVGFDIMDVERELGIPRTPGCQLVLQDVLTLHGSQFKHAAAIVGSSPCQEFSYRHMPWKRAKALPPPVKGIELFDAQFRIQREASEAAGHHIPLIVENVVGAQKWVGRAAWHYGSFYLWGNVPALMPIARAIKNTGGSWFNVAHNTTSGLANNPVSVPAGVKCPSINGARNWSDRESGVKGFTPEGQPLGKNTLGRKYSSKSPQRRRMSAEIAKIPLPLARHIARTYKPVEPARETRLTDGAGK